VIIPLRTISLPTIQDPSQLLPWGAVLPPTLIRWTLNINLLSLYVARVHDEPNEAGVIIADLWGLGLVENFGWLLGYRREVY
jgi:hypothetical protein